MAYTIFTFLCCCLLLNAVSSTLSSDQNNIMVSLYDIIKNDTTTGNGLAWEWTNRGSSPCSWKGVTCTPSNSSITHISLRDFSISTSEILPLLCEIKSLESLDVSSNLLSSIPQGFITGCGGITGLKALNFSYNILSGDLPDFRGFGGLESLDVSLNILSGVIERQLDSLSSLRSLNLSSNSFRGPIPASLGKSNGLVELQLSYNNFQGKLSEILSQSVRYENLRLIDLSYNRLSGSIPEWWGNLTRLESLVLSANILVGTIPKTLGGIKTLSRLAAYQNGFVGKVPGGITKYVNFLDLSYNRLSGTIPSDLLSPSNLQYLDLSNNYLEGSIPANMSSGLVRLRLGSNSLVGPIPHEPFRSLESLMYLELDNIQLNGSIPLELFSCKKLALLNLANNQLSGSLPVEIRNLTELQVLNLQVNQFVGEIPGEISNLQKLIELNISHNSLTGPIPDSISSLNLLENLDLRDNNLNGSIPMSIGSLNHLLELQLGNNQLSGPIPDMPLLLQITLNLSHNLFNGPIPPSLSRLGALEVLDLSYNGFSGHIPTSLADMDSLTHLILANNQLSGIIPSFSHYVMLDLDGNDFLIFPSPQEHPTVKETANEFSEIKITIAFTIAGFVFGNFLSITAQYLIRNQPKKSNNRLNLSRPWSVILKTEWYTYYKCVMPNGTKYCIKKIESSKPKKIMEELFSIATLSNRDIMIPRAYTLTSGGVLIYYDLPEFGSLFQLLHKDRVTVLDWKCRFSIALSVSRGLAFLHGNCSDSEHVPRILLNLSTKSIMMKSLCEPLIGDLELISVIVSSTDKITPVLAAGAGGCVPPEYMNTMRLTTSGNVYSFGVILLELLTGKPAVYEGIELANWVTNRLENREEIFDDRVSRTCAEVGHQMLSLLRIALQCISICPSERPEAEALLEMLLLLEISQNPTELVVDDFSSSINR